MYGNHHILSSFQTRFIPTTFAVSPAFPLSWPFSPLAFLLSASSFCFSARYLITSAKNIVSVSVCCLFVTQQEISKTSSQTSVTWGEKKTGQSLFECFLVQIPNIVFVKFTADNKLNVPQILNKGGWDLLHLQRDVIFLKAFKYERKDVLKFYKKMSSYL